MRLWLLVLSIIALMLLFKLENLTARADLMDFHLKDQRTTLTGRIAEVAKYAQEMRKEADDRADSHQRLTDQRIEEISTDFGKRLAQRPCQEDVSIFDIETEEQRQAWEKYFTLWLSKGLEPDLAAIHANHSFDEWMLHDPSCSLHFGK